MITYTHTATGLHVDNQFVRNDGLPELPRLGLNMELPGNFDQRLLVRPRAA